MQVYEVSDLGFTVSRHAGGGNTVVSFGDSAFLYGEGSPVVVRQRGSRARLALVTVWARLSPVTNDEGDLIEDYDLRVEVREVRSIRLQANLRALKRRGYVPFREISETEFIHIKDESTRSAYGDVCDELRWARQDGQHVDNVWIARPGHAVVRNEWSAIATAVVMVGGTNHHEFHAAIDGYETLVTSLGIIL